MAWLQGKDSRGKRDIHFHLCKEIAIATISTVKDIEMKIIFSNSVSLLNNFFIIKGQ
jgi:hypothetical protein